MQTLILNNYFTYNTFLLSKVIWKHKRVDIFIRLGTIFMQHSRLQLHYLYRIVSYCIRALSGLRGIYVKIYQPDKLWMGYSPQVTSFFAQSCLAFHLANSQETVGIVTHPEHYCCSKDLQLARLFFEMNWKNSWFGCQKVDGSKKNSQFSKTAVTKKEKKNLFNARIFYSFTRKLFLTSKSCKKY